MSAAAGGVGFWLVVAAVVEIEVEQAAKPVFGAAFGRQRRGDDGGEVFGKLSAILDQHFAGLAGVVMGLLTTNVLASFPP